MTNLKHFYVDVKGVIYNPIIKKTLVLMKPDEDNKNYWNIHDGRIDENETINETLKRELEEEIPNIKGQYSIKNLVHAHRLPKNLKDGLGLMVLFYKVETSLENIEISKEHSSYKWVDKDELQELKSTDGIYINDGYYEALELVFE